MLRVEEVVNRLGRAKFTCTQEEVWPGRCSTKNFIITCQLVKRKEPMESFVGGLFFFCCCRFVLLMIFRCF